MRLPEGGRAGEEEERDRENMSRKRERKSIEVHHLNLFSI